MLMYGALIDCTAKLTAGEGFRFNAYIWQSQVLEYGSEREWLEDESPSRETPVLDLYVKGLRVKNGLIHLPAMSGRQTAFPVVFLPPPFAEAVVDALIADLDLRAKYPGAFPLVRKEVLIKELSFPEKDLIRDYPVLARARGGTIG